MTTTTTLMRSAREQALARLEPLFMRLMYEEDTKVFVSHTRTLYDVRYMKLNDHNMTYDDLMCFVLVQPNLVGLFTLKLSPFHGVAYQANEVPFAFSRAPTKVLQVRAQQIIGYLLPCSKR